MVNGSKLLLALTFPLLLIFQSLAQEETSETAEDNPKVYLEAIYQRVDKIVAAEEFDGPQFNDEIQKLQDQMSPDSAFILVKIIANHSDKPNVLEPSLLALESQFKALTDETLVEQGIKWIAVKQKAFTEISNLDLVNKYKNETYTSKKLNEFIRTGTKFNLKIKTIQANLAKPDSTNSENSPTVATTDVAAKPSGNFLNLSTFELVFGGICIMLTLVVLTLATIGRSRS